MDSHDEVTMYLVVRADLKMSKGKIAAQAGHAVQLTMRAVEHVARNSFSLGRPNSNDGAWLKTWEAASFPKIVLRVDSAEELDALAERLDDAGMVFAKVVDEGRTEIAEGTVTALGIQPTPRGRLTELVGHLRLLT